MEPQLLISLTIGNNKSDGSFCSQNFIVQQANYEKLTCVSNVSDSVRCKTHKIEIVTQDRNNLPGSSGNKTRPVQVGCKRKGHNNFEK